MNYVTLVNGKNLIKDKYLKNLELVDYKTSFDGIVKLEKITLEAYLKLKNELEKNGIYIEIASAYRSIEEQQEIITEFENQYGKDYAAKYIAPVGYSEHHTGLALDLCINKDGKLLIRNEDLFANNHIFLEIHKYLHKFGFILRYPKDKKKVTGYDYEPWHIRYVGNVPAKIIYEQNLSLEEYLTNFSGVLLVNKEKDMTSRDVVNEVSRILGIKKIGHTGTLDPMAEGVLVLTIGRATKLGELLTAYEKEYIAEVKVGVKTDTLDITGNILEEKHIDEKIDYENLLKKFPKKYNQEVPIYSAVKVNGKKLYEYARKNENVDLPKKEVIIKKIELLEENKEIFKFKCLVSKGTYIRSLIRDLGNQIDKNFTMLSLVRTKQGDFTINNAYTLKEIKDNKFKILSINEVLNYYPVIKVDNKLKKKIINGCKINNDYNIENMVLFKDKNDNLIAIYKKEGSNLKIFKMINNTL